MKKTERKFQKEQKGYGQKKNFKFYFIKRQEKWTLTFLSRIIILVTTVSVFIFSIANLHPFLAPNAPIKAAELLVVEGWSPDYVFEESLKEFKSGSYSKLITIGGPLDRGYYLLEYKNFASLAAETLKKLGMNEEKLIAAPAPKVVKDRTEASVIAFRQWLSNSGLKVKSVNLVSLDVHARRSWLLLKKALNPDIKVGIIAVKPDEYESNNWWKYSAGVRLILSEGISYIYTLFASGL